VSHYPSVDGGYWYQFGFDELSCDGERRKELTKVQAHVVSV